MKRSYTEFLTLNHGIAAPAPQAAPLPQIGNPAGQLVINHAPQQAAAFQTPVAPQAAPLLQIGNQAGQLVINHAPQQAAAFQTPVAQQAPIVIQANPHGIVPIQLFPGDVHGVAPVELFLDYAHDEVVNYEAAQVIPTQILPAVADEEDGIALAPGMFRHLMTPQGHATNPNNGMNTGATAGSISLEGLAAPTPTARLEHSFYKDDETSSESGNSSKEQDHKVSLMGDFNLPFTTDELLGDQV